MAIPIRPGVYKQEFDNSITMSVGGLGGIGVPARFEKGEIGIATQISDRETLERLFGKAIKDFNEEDYAYIDNIFYYTGNVVVSRVEDTEFNYTQGNYTVPCENAESIVYSNGGSAYCNNMFNINGILKSINNANRVEEWNNYENLLGISDNPSNPDFSMLIRNSNEDFEEIYNNLFDSKSRKLHSGFLSIPDNSFNVNSVKDGSLMIAYETNSEGSDIPNAVCKVFNRRKVAELDNTFPLNSNQWKYGSIVYKINRVKNNINGDKFYPLIEDDALVAVDSSKVSKVGYVYVNSSEPDNITVIFDSFNTSFKLTNDFDCYVALTTEEIESANGESEYDKVIDAVTNLFNGDSSTQYVLGKVNADGTIDTDVQSNYIFIPEEGEEVTLVDDDDAVLVDDFDSVLIDAPEGSSSGAGNNVIKVMFDYVYLYEDETHTLPSEEDTIVKFVCYDTYEIIKDFGGGLKFKPTTEENTEFCRVVARTAGKWADNKSIQVLVCPMLMNGTKSLFDEVASRYFNFNPNMNEYGTNYAEDQIAVVVFVDGSAMEKYIVSVNPNAKTADGLSNYWNDVINNSSQYIYFAVNPDYVDSDANVVRVDKFYDEGTLKYSAEITNVNGGNSSYKFKPTLSINNVAYSVNSNSVQAVKQALKAFADRDSVELEYLCDGAFAGNVQIKDALVDLAVNTRCGDCVVVVGPRASEFQGVRYSEDGYKRLKDYLSWVNNSAENQYVAFYANTKQVYDSQNDSLVWISCSSDAVGLNARVDRLQERWYAVAGTRRGILTNTIKLGWYPNDNARESMTKDRLNPIIYDRGNGNMIYDTMSLCGLNSDLSEFYNRKTLNYLQVNTENYMKNVLFEINDQTTRSQIVEAITPFYRSVYNRRGLASMPILQCDERNNPSSVVTQGICYLDVMIQFNRCLKRLVCRYRVTPQGATMTSVSEE